MLMAVFAVSIAPFLWETCDRRATHTRLGVHGSPVTKRPLRADADLVSFLSSVARAVRAGESGAGAVISAPATCREVAQVQQLLLSGSTVADATAGDHPHLRVLRACTHAGTLSVVALDRAVADERFRVQAQRDVDVAAAQAGRSMRVLTFLPFVFLLLLAGISPNVRSHLMSPLVAAAVCVGVVLNIIGRRWVHALISRAVSVSPDQGLHTTIASTIALHLCAGGSVTDAFGALASIHPVCARVNSLLHDGHLISESLVPLEEVAPTVVRCILDAHRDGLPVNESMMRIADDLRASSFAHIQSRIAEVAVRSTTPLVLCTLPSFLLIGIAPLALAALAGLSAPTM